MIEKEWSLSSISCPFYIESCISGPVSPRSQLDYFASTVPDDTMINEGFAPGFQVVFKREPKYLSGQLVMVRISGNNFARRIVFDGDYITLKCANPAYETRRLLRSKVKIAGRALRACPGCELATCFEIEQPKGKLMDGSTLTLIEDRKRIVSH